MLDNSKRYFFVGIKGSGMSSLALIVHDLGYKVLGSDITEYTFTEDGLRDQGIEILPFDPANLKDDMIVVAGNAFGDDHPEIVKAHEMGLTVQRYHEFLGELMNQFTSIGIAGAHGKTSTTGIMAHVLAGITPTSYLIGDGSGKGVKDSRFFVFEADEYQRHFMPYHPNYMIMTNIDFDHPDYFKDINDVFDAFQAVAKQVKNAIFVDGDDKLLQQIKVDIPKYTYGFSEKDDFSAQNIVKTETGSSFDVYFQGKMIGNFNVHLFGNHGILNSLAVIAVSYIEKLDMKIVSDEITTFSGVKRRFAESRVDDYILVDDYAHHPSEIKATIQAARQKYPDKKLVTIFQPHTYSRTKKFLNQFAEILSEADQVLVTPIFGSARESSGDVSSQDLVNLIGDKASLLELDSIDQLKEIKNAVFVFMGAGDIQKYERAFTESVK